MMDLNFKGSVSDSDGVISDTDIKVDTEDVTPEIKETQDKVAEKMNDNSDTADTSGGESEDKSESDKSKEEESSWLFSQDEDEPDGDDKKSADGEVTQEKGKYGGFDTFEEYKSAMDKKLEDASAVAPAVQGDLGEAEKQKNEVVSFLNAHADIIPKSSVENYQKFYESGDETFLKLDNNLYRLTKELEYVSEKLPIQKRMDIAFTMAFKDEIAAKEKKKGIVETELRVQKVNKSASLPVGDVKNSNSNYTKEQLDVARKMGVTLPGNN